MLVQVHYFAPHELNTVAMRREITRRIAAAGFTRPSITPASDGTSQHYVYECEDVVATSEGLAMGYASTNGLDELLSDFGAIAEIPDSVILDMLVAEAEIVAPAQAAEARAMGRL